MPTYTINGKRVTTQQELTDEQIDEIASDIGGGVTQPASQVVPQEPMTWVESKLASLPNIPKPVLNMAGGASGLMRGTANIVGSVFGNSKLGQQIWPTAGLDKTSLSYIAGEMLDPVSIVTGTKALQVAGKLPVVARAAPAMRPVIQGAIGGGTAGAVTGGLSEDGSAISGGVLGTTLGAGLPIIGVGAQKLGKIVAPLKKEGAQVAGGRMLNEVVGQRYDDVLSALRAKQGIFEKPTVGQATAGLQIPELAALESIANARNPTAGTARMFQQRGERAGLIGSFAGTDKQIADLVEARGAAMGKGIDEAQLLGLRDRAAREALSMPPKPVAVASNLQPGMKTLVAGEAPIAKTAPILERLRENPLGAAAVEDAKALARGNLGLPKDMMRLTQSEIDDIVQDPMKSVKGLQLVKFAIDNRLAPTMAESASAKVKVQDSTVTNVKNALMSGIKQTGQGGEKFMDVNKEFAEKSKDIFQKRVGQSMLAKLQSPLGDKETPATLARALEKETGLIKESSGFLRQGLDEQLTPENAAKVSRVIGQLDVDSSLDELAKRGMRSEKIKTVTGEKIELPNLMNQAVALTNSFTRRVFGAGQIKTLRELATIMQDPAMTAKMMETATAKEKNALRFMEKIILPLTGYSAAQVGTTE